MSFYYLFKILSLQDFAEFFLALLHVITAIIKVTAVFMFDAHDWKRA